MDPAEPMIFSRNPLFWYFPTVALSLPPTPRQALAWNRRNPITIASFVSVFSLINKCQGLRSELDKQKEEMSKLEAEAEEMRERIKKLAKFEKQEKGQSALNEELKKMEQETGISVSYFFFRVTGGVFQKR